MSRRSLSVEIFRDINTPDVSIDAAVEGLEAVRGIVGSLEIVARNGLLRLTQHESDIIRTDQLPALDIRTDFGLILTGRPIVMPSAWQRPIHEGNITVGLTVHPDQANDYALIDAARTRSLKNSTMHEAGHLLGIPNRGKHFDGGCHCRRGRCLMHAELRLTQTDYCNKCKKQLARSAERLLTA